MRLKMTVKSRKELLEALRPLYANVSWKEKQSVLDSFVAATGYNRKHAIVLLNGESKSQTVPSRRASKYDSDVSEALIMIWKASNRICSKRLVPFLPTMIDTLERFGHLVVSTATRAKLLSISHASVDRLLREERKKYSKRKSTTKPGYLLKKHIPVRTYSDWNEVKPGFFEADLVAHGGSSVAGQFLQTLTMTDIATGWTECIALLCKSEYAVLNALNSIVKLLPFALLGFDTDNGSEFINEGVLNWCIVNEVTFTRSREYRKNDQAHVEEKNGSIVRRLVGYDRYEGADSLQLLSKLYATARLYINFFQPSLKLSSKERDGGNVRRRYEKAATPYSRICESSNIDSKTKKRLKQMFESLDPIVLLADLEMQQSCFWSTAVQVQEGPAQKIFRKFVSQSADGKGSKKTPTLRRPRRAGRAWTPPLPYGGEKKGRKTSLDDVWDEVCSELDLNPSMVPRQVMALLEERYPSRFRKSQLSTVSDKLRLWRYQHSLPTEFERLRPGRKSNVEEVWQLALGLLETNPTLSCNALMKELLEKYPDRTNKGQRTSVYERLRIWRIQNAQSTSSAENEITGITIFEEALDVVSKMRQE